MDELGNLLSEARDFVGKSRCSVGHSVSEVADRAKPGMRYCLYCAAQLDLYQRLSDAVKPMNSARRETGVTVAGEAPDNRTPSDPSRRTSDD